MGKKGNTIANAYVNLIPSAEGFQSGVEKAISEGTSAGAKTASLSISNLASGFAMGIGSAAFGAVEQLGSKVVDVAKSSIASYADYEQLVGGVETLFGNAAKYVEDYADVAYKKAGLSANEYMETVNSMAAALNQATGSEWQSAKLADQAVVDMADNANKMGTSMEAIQNAYNGFTKQNFTMLDNLKLGYGGTKSEMERLLADATALSGVEYDLNSYADIVKAIHVIQEEMGIAGTTQKEASTTIQGSLAMVQGAWTNLLAGIANEDADLGNLFDKLLDSVFGEDGKGGFIGNILPRIEQAMQGITEFVKIGLARLPEIMTTIIPDLVNGLMDVIMGIFDNITANSDELTANIGEIFGLLIDNAMVVLGGLLQTLPTILQVAITLIHTLAEGISKAIPMLIPIIIEVVTAILDTILKNLGLILDAAVMIINALIEGIYDNFPELTLAATQIMWTMLATIGALIPQVFALAVEIIVTLVTSMVSCLMEFMSGTYWNEAINRIVHSFTDIDWGSIGYNAIDGIVQGFKNAWEKLKKTATDMVSSIKDIFTNGFDIHSPSKVFAYYGEMIDEGLAVGLNSGESIKATQELSDDITSNFNPSVAGAGGDIVIPVYLGNELLQTIIVDSLNIANYRSGGR